MGEQRCIYCGTDQDLSESDIIPDALTASKNIDLRKENIRAKLDEMLDKEDYSKLIKLGADKIRNW